MEAAERFSRICARARVKRQNYMARPSGICIYEKSIIDVWMDFFLRYLLLWHASRITCNKCVKSTKNTCHVAQMSKYWRIDKQSAPTLGVKTLIPNSHLICRSNGQKMDETHFRHVSGKRDMRCVTLTPYVESIPILILSIRRTNYNSTTFLPKMD